MPEQWSGHINETNYNTVLGGLLQSRLPGWKVRAQAARTVSDRGRGSREPDVLAIAPDRTAVAVEAKYLKGNPILVDRQARQQVGRTWGWIDIDSAVAVLYPDRLARSTGDYAEALESAGDLRFASWRSGPDGKVRFPAEGWLTGGVDALADFIETAADSEHRSARLVEEFVRAVTDAAGILDRRFPKMAEEVKQSVGEQTDQMVSSLMLNALIFHYQVAANHSEIRSPTDLSDDRDDNKLEVLDEWGRILDINYWPIFAIASGLLRAVDDEREANRLLKRLIQTAAKMASENAHTIQNLAGQVFGTLLADRKFLASFYTLPAPAALLAELAVSRLDVNWADENDVTGLRVADFACGTGALLSAVYQRIQSRVRRRGINDAALHQRMLEDVFVGCDIMPAAVHITVATLSSAHPSVDYTKTETHVMPFGLDRSDPTNVKAGSLELLEQEITSTLFGDGTEAVTARGENGGELSVPHHSCDLVIMNPPYTSPTNHTLKERQKSPLPQFAAFGMDKAMQRKIGAKVKKMVKRLGVHASDGNAGVGTDFFDLAHLKVKPGGVVAFVLPATLVTGDSWGKVRNLLTSDYKNVMVITCSSGKDEHRRFSSDTKMAETLLIATRRENPAEVASEEYWKWVNLEQTPKTVAEALAVAGEVPKTDQKAGQNVFTSRVGDAEWGFQYTTHRETAPVMIRNPQLAETLLALTDPARPRIELPRANNFIPLPLTRLGNLGTRGPLSRDIVATERSSSRGPLLKVDIGRPSGKVDFPMLWNHHYRKETRLVVQPDSQGVIASNKLKAKAAEKWQTATRLHFNVDFRFTSQPLAACLTPEPVLGGRAWPSFTLHSEGEPPVEKMDWVYPVLLWSNTTLGLMSFYAHGYRTQTGRSVVSPTRLPELLVLDARALTRDQISMAETIFFRFQHREFMPANMAYQDLTRQALDQAVLVDLLGLDGPLLERVAVIRDQWCHEPHLTGAE